MAGGHTRWKNHYFASMPICSVNCIQAKGTFEKWVWVHRIMTNVTHKLLLQRFHVEISLQVALSMFHWEADPQKRPNWKDWRCQWTPQWRKKVKLPCLITRDDTPRNPFCTEEPGRGYENVPKPSPGVALFIGKIYGTMSTCPWLHSSRWLIIPAGSRSTYQFAPPL